MGLSTPRPAQHLQRFKALLALLRHYTGLGNALQLLRNTFRSATFLQQLGQDFLPGHDADEAHERNQRRLRGQRPYTVTHEVLSECATKIISLRTRGIHNY